MNEEEWEKWGEEQLLMTPQYQAALTRMSQKYAVDAARLAAAAAKSSARAAWASVAVAVLSLVFQGVPALLDALRFASKQ